MREVDVARFAILLVVAFLAVTLLIVAALVVEAFLKGNDAAEWASATGGFLAVLAASIIAIAQSKQAQRTIREQAALHAASLEAQAKLNAESIIAQYELTKSSLESQENLQKEEFKFQRQAVVESINRDRESAVTAMAAAYGLVADIVASLDDNTGPSADFVLLWSNDAELAIQISRSIHYGHFTSKEDIISHGTLCVMIGDAWSSIKNAAKASTKERRIHHRALAKTWIIDAKPWLDGLSAGWAYSHLDALVLTPEEERAAQGF